MSVNERACAMRPSEDLRATNLPGNRIPRVLFCIADGEMVLLHGFAKKSRQTPKSDLDLALDRKRRLEAAN